MKIAKPAKLAKAFLGVFFVVFANVAIIVNGLSGRASGQTLESGG
jgi:hypothetical protein